MWVCSNVRRLLTNELLSHDQKYQRDDATKPYNSLRALILSAKKFHDTR